MTTPSTERLLELAARAEQNGVRLAGNALDKYQTNIPQIATAAHCFTVAAALRSLAEQGEQ